MQDTNLLQKIKAIIRNCEDYKGHGESRYSEQEQELIAYERIRDLIDGEGKGNGCM